MNLAAFELVFRQSIRAQLAWDRLGSADPAVVERVLTGPGALGPLLTVWYADKAGDPGEWHDPASAPLTVAEAAACRSAWPPSREARIEHFSRQYRGLTEPLVLAVPAYAIGDRLLLLDGSHRSVAAELSSTDIRAVVYTVEGPVDPTILPDLGRVSGR